MELFYLFIVLHSTTEMKIADFNQTINDWTNKNLKKQTDIPKHDETDGNHVEPGML